MKCLIVIPARMASTRFPGKPLADLAGKPMIQWVYEAACKSDCADRVIVATPDAEIIEACRTFGATAELTRADHLSGTDRIAEIAERIPAEIYVNVQGDEPMIAPKDIRACAQPLLDDQAVQMGSLYALCEPEEEENNAVVKVVADNQGFALYFSRYQIPFPRNERTQPLKKHLGLYAYRREVLEHFATWQPADLELTESLEQLRFLCNGIKIKMSKGEGLSTGVDTPEQAAEVSKKLMKGR